MATFLRDPATALVGAMGANQHRRLDSDVGNREPVVGGMAQAMLDAEAAAQRMGLHDVGSMDRAVAWMREHHFHYYERDRDLVREIAKLLDRVQP